MSKTVKNSYPKALLADAFAQYQALKKDLQYKEAYVLLKTIKTFYIYGTATSELDERMAHSL